MKDAVILLQCPDQKGIISKISDFVFRYEGNILQFDQYSTDRENERYFMRVNFCFDDKLIPKKHLEKEFDILAKRLKGIWNIHYPGKKMRMGILVSKYDHCLIELLYRWQSGELPVEIPFVISNHNHLRSTVEKYEIPYYHIPITKDTKSESEAKILSHTKDTTDFLVLARYMQIITNDFIEKYEKDIVNIHHSFLPSFKGANPYKQAYDRGVKIIGATAHYVTSDLDEGPIIEQVVEPVSHKDNLEDLKRKGKHIEKTALGNAIHTHVSHRIIRYENRTVIFK